MATFGDRYKKLIDSNPNKKSIPNTNPGKVYISPNTDSKYSDLISLNPNKQSLFNTDPGLVYISPKSNNPYVDLINDFKDTLLPKLSPLTGRTAVPPFIEVFYVVDGYVDTNYVEVQQIAT
jgi:hypothetical protein